MMVVALTETLLEDLLVRLQGIADNQGKRISIKPTTATVFGELYYEEEKLMTKLAVFNSSEMKEQQNSIIKTLENTLEEAKRGELKCVEIIYSRTDKTWGTVASSGGDRRLSAAMLMELAMRRLGFGDQE